MTDDRDFASYVAARWPLLVRCLVTVGAPLDAAHRTAEESLSRCHDDWDDRDEWADLEVHVLRELFDRWDRPRDAWWERPMGEAEADALAEVDWSEIEAGLDRMSVPKRQALALREVAGLSPDQVRAVTGVEPGRHNPTLVADLVAALDLLPVDPPRIEAMIAASAHRKGSRRMISLAAVVGLVAIAGVVTLLVLRHEDPAPEESPAEFGPVESVPGFNASPIAWYAGGKLYLPHAQMDVADVREFAQWEEGAVYLDLRGDLVTVTEDGERDLLASLGPDGSFAVDDFDDRVVWIDPSGPELVDYNLETDERRLEVPLDEPARVVFIEGQRAYITSDASFLAVELVGGAVHPAVDRRLPGELDRDGRFVLTREGGGAATSRVRLNDTATGRPVPLDIDEPRHVSAARFAPDGAVIMLVEPPDAEISEIHRCEPPYDECRRIAYYPSGGARSLLAR